MPGQSSVVLMYHRVADVSFDPWRLAVPPDRFAEQMQALRRHFQPMSLGELADALDRGEVPSRAVAVTFDDGYRDNLYAGKPALEQYEIPATVFVTSGYVDSGRNFWWDELERITFAGQRPTSGPLEADEITADWGLPSDRLYLALWEQLHPLPHAKRSELLDRIAESAGVPAETDPNTMTGDELHRLAAAGLVDVGGHTVTHPDLTLLAQEDQLEEIRGSRLQLEDRLGGPVTSFCFPHGRFDAGLVRLVDEAGYAQCCVSEATVARPGVSRLELPRMRCIGLYGDVFAWELAKFFRRGGP
jgi:peptidoglycan/xylan/chitin deacetylase (PgdA/CDA1 family)